MCLASHTANKICFSYLFINTGPDWILIWNVCPNPRTVGEQLPVVKSGTVVFNPQKKYFLKVLKNHCYIGGDWDGRGGRILYVSMSFIQLIRAACALNAPTKCQSRSWAITEAGFQYNCDIGVVWGRSFPHSKIIMAYKRPTFCHTSSPLKPVDSKIWIPHHLKLLCYHHKTGLWVSRLRTK